MLERWWAVALALRQRKVDHGHLLGWNRSSPVCEREEIVSALIMSILVDI